MHMKTYISGNKIVHNKGGGETSTKERKRK